MMLKASLHIHTYEDRMEGHLIKYNIYDLIDWAHQLGFKVLGLTCHKNVVYKKDYLEYAEKKGILLLLGVELTMKKLKRNDLIILNVDPAEAKQVEKINTFKKLADYKKKHPEIFVLAPHPLATRSFSMGRKKLVKNIDLFDSIEHCWCYSKRLINSNRKTRKIIAGYNKPFVATSDAHFLKYFNSDYIVLDSEKLDAPSVLSAIKEGRFTNITRPKKIREIIWYVFFFQIKKYIFLPIRFTHRKKMREVYE